MKMGAINNVKDNFLLRHKSLNVIIRRLTLESLLRGVSKWHVLPGLTYQIISMQKLH